MALVYMSCCSGHSNLNNCSKVMELFSVFLRFIYLFIWERERARASMSGGEGQRENQIPGWVQSLTWDSIPGPGDHDLSWSQMLNQLSHADTPKVMEFLREISPPVPCLRPMPWQPSREMVHHFSYNWEEIIYSVIIMVILWSSHTGSWNVSGAE